MADSYDGNRAAKGQAINLAVHTAIALGKSTDVRFIYSEYLRYYELGQLLQNATTDELKAALLDDSE